MRRPVAHLLAVFLSLALRPPARAHAPAPQDAPPDCDAIYEASGGRRDYGRALACFRAQEDWMMVAIMQLNGEGTEVDVAGARASLEKLRRGGAFEDGDQMSLDEIVKRREAHPKAKAPRIDFCRDVAAMTPSLAVCDRRAEDRKAAKADAALGELRGRVDARARPAFDRAVAAFRAFVPAEADRAYQEHIDGTIRSQFAIDQEALVRRNFMATVRAIATAPPTAPRPFAAADHQLNTVYQEKLRSYAEGFDAAADGLDAEVVARYHGYVTDYRTKSRAAQRAWVRYRDAVADLAAARWPDAAGAADLARARVTEDRVRELEHDIE
jgi:uncharacterized protein YecT (DUF1311 family)